MYIKHSFFALLLIMGLISCGETSTTSNNTETTNNSGNNEEGDDVKLTEEEAKLAKLEALNQWKKFVDDTQSELRLEKLEYGCEGWGGEVHFTRENDKVRAIAVLSGGEHGHRVEKFYFDEQNTLVMVFNEEGSWIGDSDKIAQTLYYISDNTPFYVLYKSAEGKTDQIEKLLGDTEMKEIALDVAAFEELTKKLPDYKNLTEESINEFFCN